MAIFGKGKEMEKNYVTILVLVTATLMLLAGPLPCAAAEKDEDSIWTEDEPRRHDRWAELTEERVERMMSRLREADPEKAQELENLRAKDPEKFEAELRKIMRERIGKRIHEGMKPRPAATRPGARGPRATRTMRPPRSSRDEFMEWMKKNYPEEAERFFGPKEDEPGKVAGPKGKKLRGPRRIEGGPRMPVPRRAGRRVASLERYRRIFEAEKEDPKLAEVLKEDLELKKKRDKLLRGIRRATDDNEKKELGRQLEEVVSDRFDLIVRRKQIEYKRLLNQLEKLRKRVEKSEAEVEKWKDPQLKSKNVNSRIEELTSRKEEFKWD